MKKLISRFKAIAKLLLSFWANPWTAGLGAIVFYSFFSWLGGSKFRESSVAYFNYLADAFIHGRLYLPLTPSSLHDLLIYNGHLYLYWAPFPAVLMTPLVLLFGVHVSDVIIVLILAALNVYMLATLLRHLDKIEILLLDTNRRGLLVLFFALGSVILPLSPLGGVWSISQLVGSLCVILAYLAATSLQGWGAFFLTGLALGCAAATRNQLLFAGIWPAYHLLSTHWKDGGRKMMGYVCAGILPILLAIGGLAWYNWARFGNPADNGMYYQAMDPYFQADVSKYGGFNVHYIPINLYYQFIFYPFPWRSSSYIGGSLFLLSPILFGAFWGIAKGRPRTSVLFLIISILLTSIPILLYFGTGWKQVGPRYTLDFHIPLILLTAMGIKRWPIWLIAVLVLVSCVQYFVGTFIWVKGL